MPVPLEVEVGDGDLERAFKNLKKRMAFEGFLKSLNAGVITKSPAKKRSAKKKKQNDAV